MKLWTLVTSSVVFLLILSGCGISPKPKKGIPVDATLPIVKLTKTGTFVDMNAIAFEWNSIEDARVKGIYIYKSVVNKSGDKASKLTHYMSIDNRFVTHYVDSEIKPDTGYTYSFKTFSKVGESKMSELKVINSLPVLQSVVWIKSIQNMPRTAKIIWRPHSNEKVKSYIIERRTLKEKEWEKIATIEGRLNAEYIDSNLKDNFVYKYRVRVVTFDNITSSPSIIVQVVTKALPISVDNIVATTSLAKKIKINWKKSKTEDFSRYHLYRAEESDGDYKLIAKLYNNTFTDLIKEDGKEFFYRVSAVERNGLESIHNKLSIQGLTLIKPESPAIAQVKLVKGKIEINWNSKDPRIKNFTLVKRAKTGWFDEKVDEFVGILGKKFIDAEIGPNMTYFYKVFALDKFSIKSKPSIELEIVTPKTLVDNRKKQETKQKIKRASNYKITSSSKKKNKEQIIPVQDFN